jgi:hypothetical protein
MHMDFVKNFLQYVCQLIPSIPRSYKYDLCTETCLKMYYVSLRFCGFRLDINLSGSEWEGHGGYDPHYVYEHPYMLNDSLSTRTFLSNEPNIQVANNSVRFDVTREKSPFIYCELIIDGESHDVTDVLKHWCHLAGGGSMFVRLKTFQIVSMLIARGKLPLQCSSDYFSCNLCLVNNKLDEFEFANMDDVVY